MKSFSRNAFSFYVSISILFGAGHVRAQDSVIAGQSDEAVVSTDAATSEAETDDSVVPFSDRDGDRDHRPGYPQPGHPHPGHPQPGYPQPGHPHPGHPQPGYPQPGYPQPGYPQPGYPQPYFCQQFNYNQYQCQVNGCYYDLRNNGCYAQGGGYPQPLPPPNGRGVVCVAVDAGWEEHGGGHRGFGYDQYAAQQAAMGDCLRYHGRCRVTSCQMR